MRYCLLLLSTSACMFETNADKEKREKWLKEDRKMRKTKVRRKPKVGIAARIFSMLCYFWAFMLCSADCANCKLFYLFERTKKYKDPLLNADKRSFFNRKLNNGRCARFDICCTGVQKAKSYIPEFEAEELQINQKNYTESIQTHENDLYKYIYGEDEDKDKRKMIKEKLKEELRKPEHMEKIKEEVKKESAGVSAFEKKIVEIKIKKKYNDELVKELLKADLPLGLDRKAEA